MKLLLLLLFISLSAFSQDSSRDGDNYALIIIDMQPYFVERGGDDKDKNNMIKVNTILNNQIKMIEMAKKSKIPIVFIEYESHGDTNSKLKKAADGYDNIKIITKSTDGMLDDYNNKKSELSEYLRNQKIGNLIITGANGGACVQKSISGSLENNYNVLAFSKGIADFNYPQFIYPYDDLYKFEPSCENCKFREVDDAEAIELELALRTPKAPEASVNESDRNFWKNIWKKETLPNESKKQKNQTTKQ
jgi:nicotinamidase-related amidase